MVGMFRQRRRLGLGWRILAVRCQFRNKSALFPGPILWALVRPKVQITHLYEYVSKIRYVILYHTCFRMIFVSRITSYLVTFLKYAPSDCVVRYAVTDY